MDPTSLMTSPVDDRKTGLAAKLKVLSDPTRLRVLDALMDGVQCNCEIAEQLGMSLSLVSYHLRVLGEAGLVRGERDPDDARWLYYSVNTEALQELGRDLEVLLDVSRIRPRNPSCGPKRCGTKARRARPR